MLWLRDSFLKWPQWVQDLVKRFYFKAKEECSWISCREVESAVLRGGKFQDGGETTVNTPESSSRHVQPPVCVQPHMARDNPA